MTGGRHIQGYLHEVLGSYLVAQHKMLVSLAPAPKHEFRGVPTALVAFTVTISASHRENINSSICPRTPLEVLEWNRRSRRIWLWVTTFSNTFTLLVDI